MRDCSILNGVIAICIIALATDASELPGDNESKVGSSIFDGIIRPGPSEYTDDDEYPHPDPITGDIVQKPELRGLVTRRIDGPNESRVSVTIFLDDERNLYGTVMLESPGFIILGFRDVWLEYRASYANRERPKNEENSWSFSRKLFSLYPITYTKFLRRNEVDPKRQQWMSYATYHQLLNTAKEVDDAKSVRLTVYLHIASLEDIQKSDGGQEFLDAFKEYTIDFDEIDLTAEAKQE